MQGFIQKLRKHIERKMFRITITLMMEILLVMINDTYLNIYLKEKNTNTEIIKKVTKKRNLY